jgi:hypothetical protein
MCQSLSGCAAERGGQFVLDILLAVLIVVAAIVLGLAVHPLLFILVLIAAVWLAFRHPWSHA